MDKRISYKDPLTAIGADRNRLDKLQKDMSKLDKRYFFLGGDQMYSLKSHISGFWERVFSAAMEVCDHIFNTPTNEHPLILSDPQNIGNARWITVTDIDTCHDLCIVTRGMGEKYSRNRNYQRYIISRDDEDSHTYTSKHWHDSSKKQISISK